MSLLIFRCDQVNSSQLGTTSRQDLIISSRTALDSLQYHLNNLPEDQPRYRINIVVEIKITVIGLI